MKQRHYDGFAIHDGETKLHYNVVKYISRNYLNVLITPSLKTNQITHFSRLDSKAKGYRKGQPYLELKCKDGGRTDIITIAHKHPNRSNHVSIHHEEFIE